MSESVFRFPSNSKLDNIASLQKLQMQIVKSDADVFVLDLSSIQMFTPFTACYLVALIDSLLNTSKSGRIVLPDRESAKNQFEYLGVHSHFSGKPRKKSKRVPTVPLVHSYEEDYDIAFTVARLVRETHEMTDSFFHLLTLCLKELLQNAFQHAASSSGVYFCAHAVRTRKLVRLCVLDQGIGIRRHLVKNPTFRGLNSDEAALAIAVTPGTSGVKDRLRGLGLFYVTRCLQNAGGEFQMASGKSLMTCSPGQDPVFTKIDIPVKGTIVNVSFRATGDYRYDLDDLE